MRRFEMEDRREPEPATIFVCGPNVCSVGGEHEWGEELVALDAHTASVVCKKCGKDRLSCDMWGVD